ncbi:MAG: flagellar biosynthesis protein FlhB [Burkholderiales bacterium]
MADSSSQDRDLPPTERRLRKAREEGNVARSRDLGHLAVLTCGLGLLMAAAPSLTAWLRQLLASGLRFDHAALANGQSMQHRLGDLFLPTLLIILALGAAMAAVSVAAAVISGGWTWTLKPLTPDFGRINPLSGIGRLVSKAQLGDMLKACVLALLLGVVGASYLRSHLDAFALTQAQPLPTAFIAAGSQVLSGLWLLVLVLAAFALVDVPLQRFMHRSRLKMSKQDIKDENKEQEGSPEIKNRIKQRMREISRRRMLAAVPKADLVVMNPTHFAVALKYDEDKAGAPRVVAKGADLLAFKIRDLAKEHKVPVLQAPPLARALYAHVELDREVPLALYSAVAQVLAYVFQLRNAMAGRGPMPGDLPPLQVPPELDPLNADNDAAAEPV